MSQGQPETTEKKRAGIRWDEGNLAANEQWHKEHPVTMRIDEPKTPFVAPEDVPGDDAEFDEDCDESTWQDAPYNHVAASAMQIASSKVLQEEQEAHSTIDKAQPTSSSRRTLSVSTTEAPTDEEIEIARKEKEFALARKAVYADEGRKYLALKSALAHQSEEEEEEGA